MTAEIFAAKQKKNISWAAIAELIQLSEVWVTSACLGQNSAPQDVATKLGALLDLSDEAITALQTFPAKGIGPTIPTDPLLYRLYEICFVYGLTIKELINEKCGDGIMSAIDFSMHINKIEDAKGDRVQIIMNGKFLPYKIW
jgi:cyanate lyase